MGNIHEIFSEENSGNWNDYGYRNIIDLARIPKELVTEFLLSEKLKKSKFLKLYFKSINMGDNKLIAIS